MASPPTESTDDTVDFDEQALYRVVRSAVEDAILGVLGTLLLLAIAAFFVFIGFDMLRSTVSAASLGFGGVFIAFGLYLGAATLGLIPPLREWV